VQHFYVDAKREFAEEYIFRSILMNGMYEGLYPLGTALSRPLIAKRVVEIARRVGADAVAHGCTSKGNDQVRFELTIKALAPDLKIIAPARVWGMTRAEELEYAKRHGLPVSAEHRKFSIDDNLWSRSVEGGPLDDPAAEPSEEVFKWTVAPEKAPDKPTYLTLEFRDGLPIAINGERADPLALVTALNGIGGANGIGRIDHMESRVVGLKSREVYEAPAAVILYHAHRDLEKLVLTPRELRFKHGILDTTWSDLVYQGLWVEPLRVALERAAEEMERWVTGTVRVKLYKGALWIVGRESPYSSYSRELADYNRGWYPSDEEARGFIEMWGLHSLIAIRRRRLAV
jgi:argininosuccinate synthase